MPQPYDYSTQQVNVDNYFNSLRQGREDRAQQDAATRQSALQKYMPGALKGDAEARAQVMANANPDQQIALQNRFDGEPMQKIEQAMKMNGAITQLLGQVRDGDQQGFAAAVQRASQLGIPMDQMGHLTVADLPRLRAESGQTARELDIQFKQAQIAAQKANAAQSYAAADYSRRRAAAPAVAGGVSVDPETGALIASPGLSNMKLTEGQSKDIAFLNRANAANNKLDADRTAALVSSKNLGRNVPFVGNALQSSSSRQGGQIGKDFIAAVLRKDTGAAVTEQEFSFYSDIFLPQWGDDEASLKLKEQSRKSFLDGMRSGLSNGAALARMGVIPPPELAVPGATETPPPAAKGGKPGATPAPAPSGAPEPPPGFVITR